MTKVIIIQGGDLESYYEQTINYLRAKYHQHHSNLLDLHVSANERGRQGYYEGQASEISAQANAGTESCSLGKMVV